MKNKNGEGEVMKNNVEKRCKLCNKPYTYRYDLFGRKCISNLYLQLNIRNQRFISNKEKYLCTIIALRNHKIFLSREKKYALAENYIAMDYINKMDLKSLEEPKRELLDNIKNISLFRKNYIPFLQSTSLNDFYKIYNDYNKFKELLQNKDNNFDEDALKGFELIFDANKILIPIVHNALCDMQYMFWKVVVIGGMLAKMKVSAYLMQISLDNSGEYKEEGQELIINDKEISNLIMDNEEFKSILKNILKEDEVNIENKSIEFHKNDLLLSIHKATLNLRANKNDNETWKLNIEIKDTYDFTDIKGLKDYIDSTNSLPMSLFSSTLNNFAAISSSYNVIKPFNFVIKIDKEDYIKE